MFDTGPSEIASNAIGKVSQFADAFFVIVITFLGFVAWRRGEREGKIKSHSGMSMPTFLMAHDAAKAVAGIEEETRKANAIMADMLREIVAFNRGQVLTHELLENIRNNQEMRDPAKVKRGV